MIHFIANDPKAGQPPLRRCRPRPDRASGRAGFTISGNQPRALHEPGTPGFVQWQARQAAILAVEAWEKVLGTTISSWATNGTGGNRLLLVPDGGVDLNAFYDRTQLAFFHHPIGDGVAFSGASTDIVAHETGHALLDAIRPDLFDEPLLEVGGFHEAFGDVTALVTALADQRTRRALLATSPDLGKANFVEGTGEDLSDAVRRVIGASHPASKPRRALNTFRWQLPSTMPAHGGPDEMIAEVHSIARIMTGCFYDLVRALFAASARKSEGRLWKATRTAAELFWRGAATAPVEPRFFRAVGRAMVLADDADNGGAHRHHVGKAFADHGLALGAQALLAPELALAGPAPRIDRRRRRAAVDDTTKRDLVRHMGLAADARPRVELIDLKDTPVAKVTFRVSVPLDGLDPRLAGVVTPVDVSALVGDSGGKSALLRAPRAGTVTQEVHDFVRSILEHDQLEIEPPPESRAFGTVADDDGQASPVRATHAVVARDGSRELHRLRFNCR